MGRKGKATQPSCDERNPRGWGWRRANYRDRANTKQAKKLMPSKPRCSRLFK